MTIHDLAKQPFPIGFEFIAADKNGDTWYYESQPKAVIISKAHNLDGWCSTRGRVRWAGETKNTEPATRLCFDASGKRHPHRAKRGPNPNGGRRAAPKDERERKKRAQREAYNELRRKRRLENPKPKKLATGIKRLKRIERLKARHKETQRLSESIKPPEFLTEFREKRK